MLLDKFLYLYHLVSSSMISNKGTWRVGKVLPCDRRYKIEARLATCVEHFLQSWATEWKFYTFSFFIKKSCIWAWTATLLAAAIQPSFLEIILISAFDVGLPFLGTVWPFKPPGVLFSGQIVSPNEWPSCSSLQPVCFNTVFAQHFLCRCSWLEFQKLLILFRVALRLWIEGS